MKIFLGENHSCGLNYQFRQIYEYLQYYLVNDVKDADIIIFPSTCSCTAQSIYYMLSYIDSLYEQNQNAKIYVTGCITRKIKEHSLSNKLYEFFKKRNIKTFTNLETGKLLHEILQEKYDYEADDFGYFDSYKNDSILYISTGCMNSCSFCKATYQEMPLKSANIDDLKVCIDNIDRYKFERLIIRGTNISQYGYDLYGQYKLPELIEYIEQKNNIKKVDLIGFAFKDAIHNGFKEVIKNSKKIDLIDGSLESGSNRILKLIRKGFTSEEFVDFISGLENKKFSLAIIAGFPTETKEDINNTVEILSQIKNVEVNICKYINSKIVDSNQYEQLPQEVIEEHTRIYQKILTRKNIVNEII